MRAARMRSRSTSAGAARSLPGARNIFRLLLARGKETPSIHTPYKQIITSIVVDVASLFSQRLLGTYLCERYHNVVLQMMIRQEAVAQAPPPTRAQAGAGDA